MGLTELKKQGVGRLISFGDSREDSLSTPFSASIGCLGLEPCIAFSSFASVVTWPSFLTFLHPSYKDPCDYIKPTWIKPATLST